MNGHQVWELARAMGGDFAARSLSGSTEDFGEARIRMEYPDGRRTEWTFYFADETTAAGFRSVVTGRRRTAASNAA
jgi:hypothetical protein